MSIGSPTFNSLWWSPESTILDIVYIAIFMSVEVCYNKLDKSGSTITFLDAGVVDYPRTSCCIDSSLFSM